MQKFSEHAEKIIEMERKKNNRRKLMKIIYAQVKTSRKKNGVDARGIK